MSSGDEVRDAIHAALDYTPDHAEEHPSCAYYPDRDPQPYVGRHAATPTTETKVHDHPERFDG